MKKSIKAFWELITPSRKPATTAPREVKVQSSVHVKKHQELSILQRFNLIKAKAEKARLHYSEYDVLLFCIQNFGKWTALSHKQQSNIVQELQDHMRRFHRANPQKNSKNPAKNQH